MPFLKIFFTIPVLLMFATCRSLRIAILDQPYRDREKKKKKNLLFLEHLDPRTRKIGKV